ncbi:MAG: amino acid ABC transporter substrate-binding protein [Chitinophagia bacterium]|nr:amino acid ABC transporter substrate-binding protein [Chitinophagia bacterium]
MRFVTYLFLFVFAFSAFGVPANATPRKKKKKKITSTAATSVVDSRLPSSTVDGNAGADSTTTAVKSKRELRRERKAQRKREKKERKEQRRRAKLERKNGVVPGYSRSDDGSAAPVVIRKWADIDYPATTKKETYRVEVLLPLYLDELVKNGNAVSDIPAKALAGLNVYKGIQIAADTMKRAGLNVELYVHDITSAQETTDKLLKGHMLDSADLIIGSVPLKELPQVADLAKNRQINYISLDATSEAAIHNNPYFTTLQPTLATQAEWVYNTITDSCKKCVVNVIYPLSDAGNEALAYCKNDKERNNRYHFLQYVSRPDADSLRLLLDTAKTNYVFAPITNGVVADSLLRALRRLVPRARIEVFGLSNWVDKGLQRKDYGLVNVVVPAPFVYDNASPGIKYINRMYKREYGGKPADQVYLGYQAIYWYANMLQHYGLIFNRQYADNQLAPLHSISVKPHWDAKGNVSFLESKTLFKAAGINNAEVKKE